MRETMSFNSLLMKHVEFSELYHGIPTMDVRLVRLSRASTKTHINTAADCYVVKARPLMHSRHDRIAGHPELCSAQTQGEALLSPIC